MQSLNMERCTVQLYLSGRVGTPGTLPYRRFATQALGGSLMSERKVIWQAEYANMA